MINRFASLALGLSIVAGFTTSAVAQWVLPVVVSPQDKHIRYTGRFDRRDPSGPRCSWAGSAVALAFQGTSVVVRLQDDAAADYFKVMVDGHDSLLQTNPGVQMYPLAQDLAPGPHVVQLTKRTEPLVGTTQWLGFELNAGAQVLRAPAGPRRHLEVIGDSISCGFGNEGKDQHEHFSARTENNTITYEAIAAQALGADYTCIAWSGRKMAPDNTMPDIYDRVLPQDSTSRWFFNEPQPDAVVINLGTNDFGPGGCPDREMWTAAYLQFVRDVLERYPATHVFCSIGPMMTDTWPPGQHQLSAVRSYVQEVVSRARDRRVSFLEFPPQKEEDGFGSDWHPSRKTHELMAGVLEGALRQELHW